jgi:predicted DNA-binding mobile mystery protein A
MLEKRFFSRLHYWVRANLAAWVEIRHQKNWLRSARVAQGLKGLDLAKRLGVSPARVSMMESDEEKGAVTLKMMQRAAHALDCEFVYVLVPKKALSKNTSENQNKPKIRIQAGSSAE